MHKFLPTSLLALTCLSSSLSLTTLILSLFAFNDLWLDTAMAALTVIYHIIISFVSWWTIRNAGPATHSIAYNASSIGFLVVLWAMWIAALGMTIHAPDLDNAPSTKAVQTGESVVVATELLVMAILLVHCVNGRRRKWAHGEGKSAAADDNFVSFLPSLPMTPAMTPSTELPPQAPKPLPTMTKASVIRVKTPIPPKARFKRTGSSRISVKRDLSLRLAFERLLSMPPEYTFKVEQGGRRDILLTPSATASPGRVSGLQSPDTLISPTPTSARPKGGRAGNAWSYVTPGRPSMMAHETPLRTHAGYF